MEGSDKKDWYYSNSFVADDSKFLDTWKVREVLEVFCILLIQKYAIDENEKRKIER